MTIFLSLNLTQSVILLGINTKLLIQFFLVSVFGVDISFWLHHFLIITYFYLYKASLILVPGTDFIIVTIIS